MSFIGITGYERSGKDTAAIMIKDLLKETRPELFVSVIGLADAVRDLCLKINPDIMVPGKKHYPLRYIIRELGWEKAKDEIPAIRETMQAVGSSCRNVIALDCFIQAAKKKIYDKNTDTCTIVKDVRMDNEGKWCWVESDLLINIVRPGYGPVNDHESAQGEAVKYADVTIFNDGTEEDLRDKLRVVMSKDLGLYKVKRFNGEMMV